MIGRAAGDDKNLSYLLDIRNGQAYVLKMYVSFSRIELSAEGVLYGARLFKYFLEHEMAVALSFSHGRIPADA